MQTKETFLENVARNLEKRIEMDYVEVRGPPSKGGDQRAILAHVVNAGLAEAVCFPTNGSPAPPIEVLHKKAVVLAPGSFEHVDPTHTAIHEQLLASGVQQLRGELDDEAPARVGFFCLSVVPIENDAPAPEVSGLLKRIDALNTRGGGVLLFRERELYSITTLVNRYTNEHVRFVVDLSLLSRVWEYRYAKNRW